MNKKEILNNMYLGFVLLTISMMSGFLGLGFYLFLFINSTSYHIFHLLFLSYILSSLFTIFVIFVLIFISQNRNKNKQNKNKKENKNE